VLKVLSDILLALDSGNLALLRLLDLYAAFESVDHTTLLRQLQKSYGLCGTVLSWFTSHITARTQCVRTSVTSAICIVWRATGINLLYGVPQGSVLRPILFVLYTADVLQLVRDHGLVPHAYADDTQILGICSPSETDAFQTQVSDCLDAVASWMAANRLQLNHSKTDALWCSSTRRQHQIPTRPVRVGGISVQPVVVVRNLGIQFDADVTMRSHVTATVCSCFATLRQISSIRHSLLRPALLTLIRALVISKLDYCCSVLAGAPETLLHRLQSVLNAAAQLVSSSRKTEHTSPLLRELHWLKVPERIKFRLCVLTYRCLYGTAPSYVAETIRPVSDLAMRRHLRSADTSTVLVPTTRLSTLGDRAFPAAAARALNSLPCYVKTVLFRLSYTFDRQL